MVPPGPGLLCALGLLVEDLRSDAVRTCVARLDDDAVDRLDALFKNFHALLVKANYKHITKADIEKATQEVSDWGLNMDVDFSVFERIDGFYRGDVTGKRSKRHWLSDGTTWFSAKSALGPWQPGDEPPSRRQPSRP